MVRISTRRLIAASCALAAHASWMSAALAAGGAFAVDNAAVDDAGTCKVETWASAASSGDRVFALAPACAFALGQPAEFGLQFDRVKFDGEWESSVSFKAKTAILPFPEDALFGMAISASAVTSFDTGNIVAYALSVPLSVRIAEPLQFNLQVGGIRERADGRTLLTWGAGIEMALNPQLTFVGEVFRIGPDHSGAQAGLRFVPHREIELDLIYGRNLAGEHSDWITLGVNVRF